MSPTGSSWLRQLIWRRYLIITGVIAWGFGSNLLRTSQEMVAQLSWHPLVTGSTTRSGVFFLLLLSDLAWIVGSLAALRSLAREPSLKQRIERQWWAIPPLLQIVVFIQYWIVAVSYTLISGDVERGVVLGWMSWLHVLVLVTLGPMCLRE